MTRKHLLKNVLIDSIVFFNRNGVEVILLYGILDERASAVDLRKPFRASCQAVLLGDVGTVLRLQNGARFVDDDGVPCGLRNLDAECALPRTDTEA